MTDLELVAVARAKRRLLPVDRAPEADAVDYEAPARQALTILLIHREMEAKGFNSWT